MLIFARCSLCVLGLLLTLGLFTACEPPLPPQDPAEGSQTRPGDVGQGQGENLPPAVLMVRDQESGTDLAAGSEKTVDTAEGIVKIKKTEDGSLVDEYDGQQYPR